MRKKINYCFDVTTRGKDKFGHGITIWENGTWILDGSCFTKDKMITLSLNRFKVFKIDWKNKKLTFKLKEIKK